MMIQQPGDAPSPMEQVIAEDKAGAGDDAATGFERASQDGGAGLTRSAHPERQNNKNDAPRGETFSISGSERVRWGSHETGDGY